jgi:hypothetical protein
MYCQAHPKDQAQLEAELALRSINKGRLVELIKACLVFSCTNLFSIKTVGTVFCFNLLVKQIQGYLISAARENPIKLYGSN